MLETSSLSLEEFVFASKTRKPAEGKQRHVVDGLRTVCWFHELRIRLKARSVYEMDDLVEGPLDIHAGTKDRKSRWRSYAKGRHTPGVALARAIDGRCPGTWALLSHPLWDVLRRVDHAPAVSAEILGRLHPEIYGVVRRRSGGAYAGRWDGTRIGMLERRAGLDALAALILAAFIAMATRNPNEAFRLSRSICRVLLMIGPWLREHGIAEPMAQYIEECLLTQAGSGGLRYAFRQESFLAASRLLERYALLAESSLGCGRSRQARALMLLHQLFLHGDDLVVATLCQPTPNAAP